MSKHKNSKCVSYFMRPEHKQNLLADPVAYAQYHAFNGNYKPNNNYQILNTVRYDELRAQLKIHIKSGDFVLSIQCDGHKCTLKSCIRGNFDAYMNDPQTLLRLCGAC
jgi:hypothetical protein